VVAAPVQGSSPHTPPLSLRSSTGCLFLPVSIIWLCDGANIFIYICEWSLFAVYFSQRFDWSSTLTGAAQSAGDLLAAGILALTTTTLWSHLLRNNGLGGRSSRAVDKWVLQPPWNLALFFALYAVTFLMLAQPTFAVSVVGQVFMGTIYVFNRQVCFRRGTKASALVPPCGVDPSLLTCVCAPCTDQRPCKNAT
jgi:hypothetical protein